MSTYSPNRRGSIISNCTNDSDIASDKTPISGQPKKLRKQINNDEFKQNYFELNLSTSTGVQVLAFQPGSETTPKKRKRSSRRKSVPAAEEDSNNDSPRIETKQSKKRKQSIAPSVDTPSAEDICFSEDALQAMISSCDHELFENILQSQQQQQQFNTPNTTSKMEDETPKLEIKSAFNSKLKRNLACSTSNIQTTSSCSFSLKNSPETPNSSSRNRSTSNSLPIHQILNNDSNTIRKRSNSCVSISQLSNNNNHTQSNLTTTATHSPPERLMAKEMKLNVYLNLRRESENCGNSQNSPMTCSTPSAGGMSCTTPQPVQDHLVLARGSVMSTSSAPVMAQRFDSNNFSLNNMFRDEVFWTNMDSTGNTAQQPMQAVTDIAPQIDFNTGSNGALTDLACRQYVNSFFAENPRVHNECGGLDPSLFETLFNSVQGSDAFDPTQQILQPQPIQPQQLESSRVIIPELSMDDLQTMDPNQLQSLIDYLARLQSNRQSMQSPDEQNQSGGSSHLDQHVILNQQQQQNELLFDKDEFQDFFQSFN